MVEIEQSLSIFRDRVHERAVLSLSPEEHFEGRTKQDIRIHLNWGMEIDAHTFHTTVDGSLRFQDKGFVVKAGTPLNYSVGDDKRIMDSVLVEISYKLEDKYRVEGCYCSHCGKYYPYAKPSASFKCWECSNPVK